jgi:hypothetical protein
VFLRQHFPPRPANLNGKVQSTAGERSIMAAWNNLETPDTPLADCDFEAAISPRQVFRLKQGEEIRSLEPTFQTLRVVSGTAWITLDGQDVILNRNEQVCLIAGRSSTIISNLSHEQLILEVY